MDASGDAPILEAKDLTRKFGDFTAVDHLTLSVSNGEIFGLIGPNGAGKTTSIKMLTTLLPITSGSATIAGHDVQKEPAAVRHSIGYVPQLISADAQVTGYENLWVFARLYAIPREERERRIEEALDFMGLAEVQNLLVKNYSGGMIRRLEIAQALMHRPHILFLDEPTVGLDPLARDAVWEQIERLRSRYGTSIVMTTHYLEEAERLCQRVGVLHRGRLVGLGTPAALKAGLGRADATLEDVFAQFAGEGESISGGYREAGRTRRVAVRLE